MSRDDALLWLNDRLGKTVNVEVVVARGGLDASVFAAEGELRFWREGHAADSTSRDDLIGYYAVGAARVDLSDLEHVVFRVDMRTGSLDVKLARGVTLRILEQLGQA